MSSSRWEDSSKWEPLRWVNWELEGVMNVFGNISMPLSHCLAQIERAGMLIDLAKLEEVDAEYRADISRLEMEWGNLTGGINYKSSKVLGDFFHKELDLPVLQLTATGNPSWGIKVLEKLENEHPCVPVLVELKKKRKAVADFLGGLGNAGGMIQWIEDDGRVHPNYRLDGTDSGRLSSFGPNGQNISNDPRIRSLFVPRPGYAFLAADYSQLELRIPASLWEDPKMLEALQPGRDPHKLTAAEVIYNKPIDLVTKDERNAGKTVNFSILYLTGPRSLAFRLNRTPEECREFITGWFRLYSNIKKGIKQTQRDAQYLGYTDNTFGRRRRLPGLANPNKAAEDWKGTFEHLNRVAANFKIQSTGSDILSLSTIQLLYDPSPEFERLGAIPIASIHDALFFEVPLEHAEEAAYIVKETMEETPRRILGSQWRLPVEVNVGHYWGDSSILLLADK